MSLFHCLSFGDAHAQAVSRRFLNLFKLLFVSGFAFGLIAITSGCDRKPAIRVYEVEVLSPQVAQRDNKAAEATEAKPTRMIGAIVPLGTQAIFVKLTGDPVQTQEYVDEVRSIAESLTMDAAGQLDFETPAGWNSAAGSTSFALASLTPPATDNFEGRLTITPLSRPTDDAAWQENLQQNLDRWRGQVGLTPVPLADQATDELQKITREKDGAEIYLVNYLGSMGAAPMAPFMQGMMGTSAAGNAPQGTSPAGEESQEEAVQDEPSKAASSAGPTDVPESKSALDYTLPENWIAQQTDGSSMRVVSATTGDSEDAAELSVVFAGGEDPSIVELWANAVNNIESTPKEELDTIIGHAEEVKSADGHAGRLYRVFVQGSSDATEPVSQAIIGAIFPNKDGAQESRKLFVKLTGSVDEVKSNEEKFRSFVTSLRWE